MLLVGLIIGVLVIALWLVPSWFVAMHAERKGYSFIGFLLLGLLVSWIVSLIAATILDNRQPHGPTTRCPECAETILAAANVCKHCGHRLDTEPASDFR
jgi:DNA-directed RNA polymerase subunit RPC12/RpoP